MKGRPYPSPEVYHSVFGKIAEGLDPHTEADPIGVMVSLMAAFSAYIGRGPRIKGRGKSMPLMFWPVLIGLTGLGRKGTATNLAYEVFSHALPQPNAEYDFYKFTAANWTVGFGSTGIGFMETLRDSTDDGGNIRPQLFVQEEMDDFIRALKKDPRLGANIRKAWDGTALWYKTGKDEIRIPNPHMAFVGHAQPTNWGKTRGSADATGGTYNRFIPFYVHQSKSLSTFAEEGEEDITPHLRRFGNMLWRVADMATRVNTVNVPREVARAFDSIHKPRIMRLTAGNAELSEFSERGLAYVMRMATLYALGDGRDTLTKRDFDAATAMIEYSVASVAFATSSNKAFTGLTGAAEKLRTVLIDAAGPVGWSEAQRKVNTHLSKEAWTNTVRELGKGAVTFKQVKKPGAGSGGGRPVSRYVCAPEFMPELGKDWEVVDLGALDDAWEQEAYPNPWAGRASAPQEDDDDEIVVEVDTPEERAAKRAQEAPRALEVATGTSGPRRASRPRTEPPRAPAATPQEDAAVTPPPAAPRRPQAKREEVKIPEWMR